MELCMFGNWFALVAELLSEFTHTTVYLLWANWGM